MNEPISGPEWILEATISEIQAKFKEKEITSKQVVLFYLQRISKFDRSGPTINSIIEVNPDILHIAEALDMEREQMGARSILHGIPIVLKDNIDTADKMHTSAGSLILADHYAKEDAFLVKQLREAGAIILGKVNMTEWANFIADDMPTGYSSRGGQVLNPYGSEFIVGGSSSGSAAAIAANFAVASVGTETSGSILSPASQNSLVGIKPTVGLISRSGIIPISYTQDTAGPMARSVEDAAIMLTVMSKTDEQDPITKTNRLSEVNFTDYLKKDGVKGKRLGIARNGFVDRLEPEKQACIEKAIDDLKQLGAVIVDPVEIPSQDRDWDMNVLIYEFKSAIQNYLKTVDSSLGINKLSDLIFKNESIGKRALKYGQELFYMADKTSGTLTEVEYLNSLLHDQYYTREKGIDACLNKYELDAIIFPNNLGAMIPAKAGYPSITVPAGFSEEGEPIGLTFTGTAYSEPTLIELGFGYEQATKHRIPPVLD